MGREGTFTQGSFQRLKLLTMFSKDEFNPKTFFALNDLDSNGLLDLEEVGIFIRLNTYFVQALLLSYFVQVRRLIQKELENAYSEKEGEHDPREQRLKFHRHLTLYRLA